MDRSPVQLGGVLAVCAGLVLAMPLGARPAPGPQAAAGQAQPPQQQPVFRGGTTLVEVDLYPSKDGRILEGLTPADIEVLEDGRPQTIQNLVFIRVEPFTPDTQVRDPNNTREMLARAADSRNRVFVLYLDRYHTRIAGSYRARSALVDLLQRILAPNDLFGVLTTGTPVNGLTFGRRTETIERQLSDYWWELAERGTLRRDEEEERLADCFDQNQSGQQVWERDGAIARPLIDVLRMRRREDLVLRHIEDLMIHLGGIREARKSVMVMTEGWMLFQPDRGAIERALGSQAGVAGGLPPITSRGGRLTTLPAEGYVSGTECASELTRLFNLDNAQRFRDIMRLANQHNVTFYPVNPSGLQVFDTDLSERTAVLNPTAALTQDMGRVRERRDSLETLAENTDGLAVVDNDLRAGLRRIVDDVSAYYVLTYESSNPKNDGRYRRIEVKVKQPDVRVRARRGYFAPREAEPGARVVGATPATMSPDVEEAFGTLSRLREDAPLFTSSLVTGDHAVIIVELTAAQAMRAAAGGTPVQVELAKADGTPVGVGQGTIEPGRRGALVRVPLGFDLDGPWRASVVVGTGRDRLQDSIGVSEGDGVLVGQAVVFRATPSPRSPLVPVADLRFRRTERLHIEWARLDDLDRREARLLGRDGSPLAVPLTVTERDVDGQAVVAVDLNLAPLADAEYAIELTVWQGNRVERRVVAIRLTR